MHETVAQTPTPTLLEDPIPAPDQAPAPQEEQESDEVLQKSARYLEIQRRIKALASKQTHLEEELLRVREEKLSLREEEAQVSVFLFCK